jgi:hypothetical protein
VFLDSSFINASLLGDVLADFVDEGGVVIRTVFDFCDFGTREGRFFSIEEYEVITVGWNQDDPEGVFPDVDSSDSQILSNINLQELRSINSTSGRIYRCGAKNVTVGSTVVAWWNDGVVFAAVKSNVGPASARRIDLNFYPVVYNASSPYLDDSDLIRSDYVSSLPSQTLILMYILQKEIVREILVNSIVWGIEGGTTPTETVQPSGTRFFSSVFLTYSSTDATRFSTAVGLVAIMFLVALLS